MIPLLQKTFQCYPCLNPLGFCNGIIESSLRRGHFRVMRFVRWAQEEEQKEDEHQNCYGILHQPQVAKREECKPGEKKDAAQLYNAHPSGSLFGLFHAVTLSTAAFPHKYKPSPEL